MAPSSDKYKKAWSDVNTTLDRNPQMFLAPNPREVAGRFVICYVPMCGQSSGVGGYPSMLLRSGFKKCMAHMTKDELAAKSTKTKMSKDPTVIYYDTELNVTGDIEQLDAITVSGRTFSSTMMTSVRTNTSPILRKMSAKTWIHVADKPELALGRFVDWMRLIYNQEKNGNGGDQNIVLAAHCGSGHDHVHLIRSMVKFATEVLSVIASAK